MALRVSEELNIQAQFLLNSDHQLSDIPKTLGLQGGEDPVSVFYALQSQRRVIFTLVVSPRGLGDEEQRVQQASMVAGGERSFQAVRNCLLVLQPLFISGD
jgi:hypothetical protein